MSERCPSRPRQAGFTLLEVLIASSLVALIAVGVSGGLRFAARAWERQEVQVIRQGDLDPVQSTLRRLIGTSRSILGDGDGFEVKAPLPRSLRSDRYYDCRLVLAEDGRLLLYWRPATRRAATETFREVELASGILGLDTAYYRGPAPVDEGEAPEPAGWIAEWTSRRTQPLLVRVRLLLAPEDRRIWPELVVRREITARARLG